MKWFDGPHMAIVLPLFLFFYHCPKDSLYQSTAHFLFYIKFLSCFIVIKSTNINKGMKVFCRLNDNKFNRFSDLDCTSIKLSKLKKQSFLQVYAEISRDCNYQAHTRFKIQINIKFQLVLSISVLVES